MTFTQKSTNPFFVFKQAFSCLIQNKKQLLNIAAVPLFLIGFSRLLQIIFSNTGQPVFSFFTILDYILQVVFAVEWIRFLSNRRGLRSILIPQFKRTYLTYGVLSLGLFFINSLLISTVASLFGSVVGFGVVSLVLFGLATKLFYLFLFARLSPAFVGAATNKPEVIPTAWPKTQSYWPKLFGYLVLVQVVIIAISVVGAALIILPKASLSTLQPMLQNPLLALQFMKSGMWFIQLVNYIGLALELYGIWFFNKSRS